MDIVLNRTEYRPDGIFGEIPGVGVTLEHSYNNQPKIPAGTYTCKRSMHRLHGMTPDFETFQVMNVPGHSNILFHWGNYNDDSDGCILLGRNIVPNPDDESTQMITSSKNTWLKFMDLQKGLNEFTLTVKDNDENA